MFIDEKKMDSNISWEMCAVIKYEVSLRHMGQANKE